MHLGNQTSTKRALDTGETHSLSAEGKQVSSLLSYTVHNVEF